MKIYAKVKQMGKRRDIFKPKEYTLEKKPETLRDFIEVMVRINVEEYNSNPADRPLMSYLTAEAIEEGAETGKVGFGRKYNENKQDVEKAVENALVSFQDGIFRVFVDDVEYETLDTPLTITEGSNVLFLKLAMLAGRMW